MERIDMPLTDEQLAEILKRLKDVERASKGAKGAPIVHEDPAPTITNEDILKRIEEIKATLRKGA
jgi:hypothetical protein